MFINRKDFRPMLAAEGTNEALQRKLDEVGYLLCTPKLDGIRCMQTPEGLRSRSLKPIRNNFAQQRFMYPELVGVDGELIDGPPNHPLVFNRTTSAVMAYDGASNELQFYLFDWCAGESPGMPYAERLQNLSRVAQQAWNRYQMAATRYVVMTQREVRSMDELQAYEQNCIKVGYEGVIARDPQAPYKFGRSTQPQGWMLKIKRFEDSEAVIEGFEPLMHNQNAPVIDNLGLQKRSSSLEGKIAQEKLGNFLVRDPKKGWTFSVGSGLDDAMRELVWRNQETYLGKTITYKYLPHGSIDAPRHPIFKGFRHSDDMS